MSLPYSLTRPSCSARQLGELGPGLLSVTGTNTAEAIFDALLAAWNGGNILKEVK